MPEVSRAPRAVWLVLLTCWAVACATPALRGARTPVRLGAVPHQVAPLAPRAETAAPRLSPIRVLDARDEPLPLRALSVEVSVNGPLARTEMHLQLDRASGVEARLEMEIPRDALVEKVALASTGSETTAGGSQVPMREANSLAVRPLAATYDQVLHARLDPRLGRQGGGRRLVALLPPASATSPGELVVVYQELADHGHRALLRGLPPMESISFQLAVDGAAPALERRWTREAPPDDLLWRREGPAPSGSGIQGGAMSATTVVVPGTPQEAPLLSPVVLVDTSASRMLDLDIEVKALTELAASLPADLDLVVAAYDQETVPIFDGKAGDFARSGPAAIEKRRALGASNLERALGWAAHAALARAGLHHRLILMGDGLPSAGEQGPRALLEATHRLADSGFDRLDVVAVGGLRDEVLLASLAGDALASRGAVIDVDAGADAILDRLKKKSWPPLPVEVAGAIAFSPHQLLLSSPGDRVTVLGAGGPGGTGSVRIGEWETGADPAPGPDGLPARALLDERSSAPESLAEMPISAFSFGAGAARENDLAIARALGTRSLTITDEPAPVRDGEADPMDATLVSLAAPSVVPPRDAPSSKEPTPAEPPANDPPVPDVGGGSGGRLLPEVIQRVVRLNFGRFRNCYVRALTQKPSLEGRVVVRFVIDPTGAVASVADAGSDIPSRPMRDCVAGAFQALSFPAPAEGSVMVKYPLSFTPEGGPAPARRMVVPTSTPPAPAQEPPPRPYDAPYDGELLRVKQQLAGGDVAGALATAARFQSERPDRPLALLALGEAAEASHDLELAARAHGSILALWGYRADLTRTAGANLLRVGTSGSVDTGRDAFARAVALRPDHPTGQRALAFAEARAGRPEQAFRVLEQVILRDGGKGRFVGALPILTRDLGILAASWARQEPARRDEIRRRSLVCGARLENGPTMRLVLDWETDTADASLQIVDAQGASVGRGKRLLASGGELTTAIVEGYGPQEFVVRGPAVERAYPFLVRVGFPTPGALGFTPGDLQIVEHDGYGNLRFEDRTFVVMNGHEGVELGEVAAPR